MASRKKIEKWIEKGSLVYLTSLGGGSFVGKLVRYDERDDTVTFTRREGPPGYGWARASEVHRAKIKPGCTVCILSTEFAGSGMVPSYFQVGEEHVVAQKDKDCLCVGILTREGCPLWFPKSAVEFVFPALCVPEGD